MSLRVLREIVLTPPEIFKVGVDARVRRLVVPNLLFNFVHAQGQNFVEPMLDRRIPPHGRDEFSELSCKVTSQGIYVSEQKTPDDRLKFGRNVAEAQEPSHTVADDSSPPECLYQVNQDVLIMCDHLDVNILCSPPVLQNTRCSHAPILFTPSPQCLPPS